MKSSFFDTNLQALATFAVLLGLCTILLFFIRQNPGYETYGRTSEGTRSLAPETVTKQNTDDYVGVQKIYTLKILATKNIDGNEELSFFLRHAYILVTSENGDILYETKESTTPHIGHSPGNYWVTLPVHDDMTIIVTITPVFSTVIKVDPSFLLSPNGQLLVRHLLYVDGLLLMMSFIAVVSGILLTIFFIVFPIDRRNKQLTLLLGALTATAGLWKMSNLAITELMLNSAGIQKVSWYFGTMMYIIMMVLSLAFMLALQPDLGGRKGKICLFLGLGLAISLVILTICGQIEMHYLMVEYGVAIAGLILVIMYGHKPTKSELLWAIPFFTTLGLDMLIFGRAALLNRAPFFLFFTIINLAVRGFFFQLEAYQREQLLAQKEAELNVARLDSLLQQIRPHFIYNTLTSIYVLCQEDPSRAMEVISDFTDYLQANFSAFSSTSPITFSEELKHTKAYLAVESMRYGNDLSVVYDIRFSSFHLPALTLQPIVENSIKHGLANRQMPEEIIITTSATVKNAILTVRDNGPGFANSDTEGKTHIGLENIRKRLSLMCDGTLEIQSPKEGGTVVTVTIPL